MDSRNSTINLLIKYSKTLVEYLYEDYCKHNSNTLNLQNYNFDILKLTHCPKFSLFREDIRGLSYKYDNHNQNTMTLVVLNSLVKGKILTSSLGNYQLTEAGYR